jgi:hypothetical protein
MNSIKGGGWFTYCCGLVVALCLLFLEGGSQKIGQKNVSEKQINEWLPLLI